VLKAIFADQSVFEHHPPMPAAWSLADEGAANHMRLARSHGDRGVEVFVYGRAALAQKDIGAKRFPSRQTLEASQAIARRHGLGEDALYVRQSPRAIDAGAFHNDVLAVAHLNVLFYHAQAWEDSGTVVKRLGRMLAALGGKLQAIEVTPKQVSLKDAIGSYLFNSQLVSAADGSTILIAPQECRKTASTRRFLDMLVADGPIAEVRYVQVRQSMRNGGGPACLRLRVVLTERELAAVHPGVFLTGQLYEQLVRWVGRHYRDRLSVDDLRDVQLLKESRRALDELSGLLGLGAIYDHQLQ
jgi:succinylarginine dihydrolase